jgi:general secretion pathway protein B
MSSILKALRKIEEEKRVASHAAPDLRMDQGGSVKKSWPLLPLVGGAALGAVCVGLLSFWLSPEDPELAIQVPPQTIIVDAESRQENPSAVDNNEQLLESAPLTPQQSSGQDLATAPVAEDIKVQEVIMPAETVPVAFTKTESKKQRPKISPEKKMPPSEVVAAKVKTTAVAKVEDPEPSVAKPKALPADVTLKVSEVFYHDDPGNSMAVVNDLPVMIGTFVDSAVVQEIHSDKVVFKVDSQSYDVPVTPLQ